jgi:hypothetical protein
MSTATRVIMRINKLIVVCVVACLGALGGAGYAIANDTATPEQVTPGPRPVPPPKPVPPPSPSPTPAPRPAQ